MKNAVKELDGSEFKGSRVTIREVWIDMLFGHASNKKIMISYIDCINTPFSVDLPLDLVAVPVPVPAAVPLPVVDTARVLLATVVVMMTVAVMTDHPTRTEDKDRALVMKIVVLLALTEKPDVTETVTNFIFEFVPCGFHLY
jgi:hypothetical protein